MAVRAASGSDKGFRPRQADRLELLVVAVFGLLGLRIGLRPISDNSAFVHLRTGIEITRNWRVPTADPYSFTANGHPWVVQSWFASLLYGLAYRAGGVLFGSEARMRTLVVFQGLLMALLGVVVARLARTGSAVRTMATAGIATLLGAIYWSPRPLIFGLLGLALVITTVEAEASPWWLIPIGWVWVNTHGSFPLGIAWLLAVVVGRSLDARRPDGASIRYLIWFIGGCAVGSVNPVGPRLLTFPFAVQSKAGVFKNIVEWHSPNFQTTDGIAALVLLALALLVICRSRLSWADTLSVVGFVALALVSLRNVAPAAVVLAPVLGRALRPEIAPAPAQVPDPLRERLDQAVTAALVVIALLLVVLSVRTSGLDLSTYPVQAVDWMGPRGLLDPNRHRVASQDIVGCYLILLRGTAGRVFVDDRVDMYPVSVSKDYDALLHGAPNSADILSRYGVDAVLWDRRQPLVQELTRDGSWQVSYQDARWAVLTRR